MKKEKNHSLLSHNTFGMDVRCNLFVEYESIPELQAFLAEHPLGQTPWMHIGKGSNLLFVTDYPGTILHSAIRGIDVVERDAQSVVLRIGASETFDDVVALAVTRQWYGIENLSLIPGEAGAAAVQNIGAYGVEAKDVIESVETIAVDTRQPRTFAAAECKYGYRSSIFKREWRGQYIVTHINIRLSLKPQFHLAYGDIEAKLANAHLAPTLEKLRQTIIGIRQAKLPDPKVQGNAGSFFTNPIIEKAQFELLQQQYPNMPSYLVDNEHVKVPAGWLIDQCGWKGRTMGRAGVHPRQALVLVNTGGATGQEVVDLSKAIQQSVWQTYHIHIEPEVNIL